MARILVGVAWPYSNGPQHIGHLVGSSLPADIFARYHRLAGHEVCMVSGSDMHGTPTTFRAEEEGVGPEVIAERYHAMHADAFRRLGISFDLYTHTHTALHARTAQDIFLTLLQEGFVEKRSAPEAYCPKHQRSLPDRFLRGTCPHCGNPDARGDECSKCGRTLETEELREPTCRLCGTPAVFRETEQFYLMLPKLTSALEDHFRKVRDHWRPAVRTFTENYVREGLRPRPITRNIPWGVPVPLDGYPEKRLYVWFEAVIGYLSATKEWAIRQGEPDAWHRFWDANEESRVYQFMGKDNVTFHTVIWPAILLGVGGLQLPYDVPANEWLVIRGGKMSKSGTGAEGSVWLPDLLQRFDPDAIRFYGAYHMPQNHDTEFTFEDFFQDHDQVLADQWGNLVHRVLTFVQSKYGGKVPAPPAGWTAEASAAGSKIRAAHAEATKRLEAVELKEALDTTLELVREANRFFHEAKPWAQEGAERDRVVYEALWLVQALTVMLAPYVPFSSERSAQMQGTPKLVRSGGWGLALVPPVAGTTHGQLSPLFAKLLPPTGGTGGTGGHAPAPAPAAPAAPAPSPASTASGAAVASAPSPGPVAELDIVVGEIQKVDNHPKADKLYLLTVNIGEEKPRTIVAGLKGHYPPEGLQGKRVAVLANLAPRPLRGIPSEGMVLAAEAGMTVAVLRAPDGAVPGTRLQGEVRSSRTIQYDEFQRAQMVVAAPAGPSKVDAGAGPVPATLTPDPPSAFIARLDRLGPSSPQPLVLPDGRYFVPDRALPPGSKVR